jgi:hypothetical protein
MLRILAVSHGTAGDDGAVISKALSLGESCDGRHR